MVKNACHSEVSQLHLPLAIQKHVSRLQISMQNLKIAIISSQFIIAYIIVTCYHITLLCDCRANSYLLTSPCARLVSAKQLADLVHPLSLLNS